MFMNVMTVVARRPFSSTFTSVPVKPETLQRLKSYKVGGKTYDDVLNQSMDDTPTAAFWKEMDRRMKEDGDIPWNEEEIQVVRMFLVSFKDSASKESTVHR
ncbi:MAG TPA: hypothetical protein VM286_01365 [Candidatus Thermoplasmatota archaeon]|nr:hypothetical protein [Candidatus Thermoplasmatota archaeon]